MPNLESSKCIVHRLRSAEKRLQKLKIWDAVQKGGINRMWKEFKVIGYLGVNEEQFNMWIETWRSFVADHVILDEDSFNKFFDYLNKSFGGDKLASWSKLEIANDEDDKWRLYNDSTNGQESLNRVLNRYCKNYKRKSLTTAVKHVHKFLSNQVDEYELFVAAPTARKPLSQFYNTLARAITRQDTLRKNIIDMTTKSDIAIMCSHLIQAEHLADEKSHSISTFCEFARLSVLQCPSLSFLVKDVIEMPNYKLPYKFKRANLQDLQDATIGSSLNSTQFSCESTCIDPSQNLFEQNVFDETPVETCSTFINNLTPPPMKVMHREISDLSKVQRDIITDIYQDTHNVSLNLTISV